MSTTARRSPQSPGRGTWPAAEEIVWHDLECGAYRADLRLWRELAARTGGPVLEIGSGTGRVALDLARTGCEVIAVEIDATLLSALRERASGLPIRCVLGDARELELEQHDLPLCLAPMQTLQLLGGAGARAQFLAAVRRHLRPGGLLACAIVEQLEQFDSATGPAPSPDRVRIGDTLYSSRPTAVRQLADRVLLERRRQAVGPDGRRRRRREVVELDRISRRTLGREMRAAGLTPEAGRSIPATSDHVASAVVISRV